jgi:cytochrome c2
MLQLASRLALILAAGAAGRGLRLDRRVPVTGPVRTVLPEPAPRGDMPIEPMVPHGPSNVPRWAIYGSLAVVLATAAGVYGGYQYKFAKEARERAVELTAGDPDRGKTLVRRYGCAGCHNIPGVQGASGKVGPDLKGVAGRVYLGGVINNTPDNMIQWIVNPREIDEKSAMPRTGISHVEARHVAAYLYTLR